MELTATAAFDGLDEPVSIFSPDGVYRYINRAGEQLLNLRAEDVVGRPYLELFPDLRTHPYHDAFTRVASGQTAVERLEFFYSPMDRWSSQRMHRADGHVVVLWQDITQRKRAERDLEASLSRASESERQFRAMIEWMPQLAWWAQPDGFIDYYNPRWYEYTGKTETEMQGWGWQSVHDPALLPGVMTSWQGSLATGEPFEMEFPLRRHDGVFRWFLTRVAPMRNAAGEIVRWIGINTDIDEQKRAWAMLNETLESMSDAFILLDATWRIAMVNGNQERVSQTPRSKSLGRSFWEVFPATKELKYWSEYHRGMEQRVEVHFIEHYAPLALWTEVDAFPTPDGGLAVFFRDVTERLRIELERGQLLRHTEEARAQAESASRAKDEFLAMLGHELRNPLAPIVTALELIKSKGDTTASWEHSVIERQVAHLVHLVDDLMDVSRITRGKVDLKIEATELAHIVAKAVDVASPLLERRSHNFTNEVPKGMRLLVDPIRVTQIVANLLTNAAKYTDPGGTISLVAKRDVRGVAIHVRDSGIGIAAQNLATIFDLFVQGKQSSDRADGGLGLGLSLARNLAEMHGGTVEAFSDGLGHGSEFVLRFPPAVEVERLAEGAPATARVAGNSRRRLRILVVDDNVDAAELLGEMLSNRGHEVAVTHDGPQALARVAGFRPEIAILDIGLPVMDGYELAVKLRAQLHPDVPRLVALTGYGQAEDRERSKQAGFDEHLVKPVDLNKLLTAIAAMVPTEP